MSVLQTGNEALNRVSELICADGGSWDIQKVRRNFIAPDADTILNIPIKASGDD